MSEPFVAEIKMFGGNFAPRGWAFCDGQLLPISQNTALFSLLGTTYGGDGRTTFGLPDLRGRVPMHPGTGAGLSTRRLGESGGSETTVLTGGGTPGMPPAASTPRRIRFGVEPMQEATAGPARAGKAHDNMPPYLAVNFIIALVGIYPSRS